MRTDADALRIMQFLPEFEVGGTERQVLNLGLGLADRGSQVSFGCLRRSGRLLTEVEARGLPVHEYVVPDCTSDTKVVSAGSVSDRVTFTASSGPTLVRVMV